MDMQIRSESAVNLTQAFDHGSNRSDVIVLHTRRCNYPIKIGNFVRHSKHIQQVHKLFTAKFSSIRLERGIVPMIARALPEEMTPNVPRVVDLTCYNVEAIRMLADYLCDVDVRNFRLNGSMILDLLQLCQIFDIPGLKEFISVYVIENIEQGRDSPSAFIFNTSIVMSDWTLMCDDRVRQRLYAVAAQLFPQIQVSSYLAKFPLSLMVHLLGRCDLRVTNEEEVAMVALKWLQLALFTNDDVQVLFSTVRTPFLSANERREIDTKAKDMCFVQDVIDAYNTQLDSNRNARCCIIKDHARNEWKRCGVPKDYERRFAQGITQYIDLRLVIPRAAQGGNTTYYEHQLFDCVEESPQTSGTQLQNVKVDELSTLRKNLEGDIALSSNALSRKDAGSGSGVKSCGGKKSFRMRTMRASSTSVNSTPTASSALNTSAKVFFQEPAADVGSSKPSGGVSLSNANEAIKPQDKQ